MARNRILIVEDDSAISSAVQLNLKYVGYECTVFGDGAEAAEHLKKDSAYDLALLDIMLPGIDGFRLFSHMEERAIPVIYMTAKTDSASEIRGLREGAEDYIVKPFDIATLLVRIEKVLARRGKLDSVYRIGDIVFNTEERTVTKNGVNIELIPREMDVLAVLLRNRNRTVSRERLLNEVWGADFFGDVRTVDVRIANLRRKLDLADKIKTISKVGYRLEDKQP